MGSKVLLGIVCAAVGLVVGAAGGFSLASSTYPSSGDMAATRLAGAYGMLVTNGGTFLPAEDVRRRALGDFARGLANTGSAYGDIEDRALRKRVAVIGDQSLKSGLLDSVPEADLREHAKTWAECLSKEPPTAEVLVACVAGAKKKG